MKQVWFVLLVLIFAGQSPTAFSEESSAKDQFCARTLEQILAAAGDGNNRLAFQNDGGLFNGGVCWWHSRFERASDYLALYRPDLAKPTASEAKRLIHRLMLRRHVVEIPGYSNLKEFSTDFQRLIQKQLNRWQIRDGFGNQLWILSLSGKNEVSADKMKALMDQIYAEFERYDSVLTLMLQFKGPDSHMWNLIDMDKTPDGYILTSTDSNALNRVMTVQYHEGDTAINDYYQDPYVPYPALNRLDLKRIQKARARFCSQ